MVLPTTHHPSEADAHAVIEEMKSAHGLPFKVGTNCKLEYVQAALAVKRSLFRKDSRRGNGE